MLSRGRTWVWVMRTSLREGERGFGHVGVLLVVQPGESPLLIVLRCLEQGDSPGSLERLSKFSKACAMLSL